MITQLLNKTTQGVFLGLVIAVAAAFWLYLFPALAPWVGWLVVLLTLILSLCRLDWGLYIVAAELFIGSHGHLLTWPLGPLTISLRLGLFAAVFIAMLYHWWNAREQKIFSSAPRALWFFLIFVLIGIGQGIARFGFVNSFFDWNAYLYFLLLPAWFLVRRPDFILNLVRILLAAVNWLFLKTYLLLFIFAHDIRWLDLSLVYKFIRDTRLGEITYVSKNFWRIFLPSQIWAVVALVIVVLLLLCQRKIRWQISDWWFIWVSLFTASLTVLASFSRSNWLGAGLALGLALLYFWFHKIITGRKFLAASAGLILLVVIDIGFLFFWTSSFQPTLVSDRLTNLNEQALDSREAQLGPLWQKINTSLFWGKGFGQTVTYQSSDPRIKTEANPTGRYTTMAFEWGYLDIWLKIGLFGLLAYLALIGSILKKRLEFGQNGANFGVLKQGLAWGLVAVVIISIFSPYLNHPLGIGLLLMNCYHE